VATSGLFELSVRANALAPSLIRTDLIRWLTDLDWPRDQAEDIVLIASEAVTNVVDHAYPPHAPGPVQVQAEWTMIGPAARRMAVRVRDEGVWRPVPTDPGERGRGLGMIGALAEVLQLTATPTGTTLTAQLHPVATPASSQGEQGRRPDGAARSRSLPRHSPT
jgi:anti-sigma regulatory factor (Ser/Thr protein kinase)